MSLKVATVSNSLRSNTGIVPPPFRQTASAKSGNTGIVPPKYRPATAAAKSGNTGIVPPAMRNVTDGFDTASSSANNSGIVPPWMVPYSNPQPANTGIVPPWMVPYSNTGIVPPSILNEISKLDALMNEIEAVLWN